MKDTLQAQMVRSLIRLAIGARRDIRNYQGFPKTASFCEGLYRGYLQAAHLAATPLRYR